MEINSNKVLLFDIDGTLLDPVGIGRLCFQQALDDVLGYSVTTNPIEMAGRTDWQILSDLLAHAGLDDDQIETHRGAVFASLARHIEIAVPTSKIHSLPGVHTLMDRLRGEKRFLLGLVTGNSRAVVVYKLQAVGIDPSLFIVGAFGDEHIDRNALPALALTRLSRLLGEQVPSENVLVIGDTPHDIACARHTGLKVLGVATGLFDSDELAKYEPDFLLEDFSDTDAVLSIFEEF